MSLNPSMQSLMLISLDSLSLAWAVLSRISVSQDLMVMGSTLLLVADLSLRSSCLRTVHICERSYMVVSVSLGWMSCLQWAMYFLRKVWVRISLDFESLWQMLFFSQMIWSCLATLSLGWMMQSSSSLNWLKDSLILGASLWFRHTLSAMRLSLSALRSSQTMKMRSKRESRESAMPMFLVGARLVWYSPQIGLAAAITEHRALREQCMPALAMVTVCCSITSCTATLSTSFILSNSSMHTTPLSASTIAPASRVFSPVSLSETMAAVRPTPLAPLPVVPMASSAVESTHLRIWLLAVPGSPTISRLMSPRK